MAVRLIEVVIPARDLETVRRVFAMYTQADIWIDEMFDDTVRVKALVHSRRVEHLFEELGQRFGETPGFRAFAMSVDASIPRPESPRPQIATARGRAATAAEAYVTRHRLSTDELYEDIEESSDLTPVYLATVALSALIAALGLRSGLVAIVIGAMVVAPLLGPTMATAMAATLGDVRLGIRAMRTLLAGAILALALTTALGLFITVDPTVVELDARTHVALVDVVLALASGAAGALAFGRGLSSSLVGVMIAVALMPPLAAAGMLLGSGHESLAVGAAVLFLTNFVCINVAGIVTFLAVGLPPQRWRMTGLLLILWLTLLLLLTSLILGNYMR
ncbi:MAG: TIGR00341 family protein [Thermomicrobiales bacterium]